MRPRFGAIEFIDNQRAIVAHVRAQQFDVLAAEFGARGGDGENARTARTMRCGSQSRSTCRSSRRNGRVIVASPSCARRSQRPTLRQIERIAEQCRPRIRPGGRAVRRTSRHRQSPPFAAARNRPVSMPASISMIETPVDCIAVENRALNRRRTAIFGRSDGCTFSAPNAARGAMHRAVSVRTTPARRDRSLARDLVGERAQRLRFAHLQSQFRGGNVSPASGACYARVPQAGPVASPTPAQSVCSAVTRRLGTAKSLVPKNSVFRLNAHTTMALYGVHLDSSSLRFRPDACSSRDRCRGCR